MIVFKEYIMKKNDSKKPKKCIKKLLKDSEKVPERALKKGIKVEREHGPQAKGGISNKTDVTGGNKCKTAKIAAAHLKEDPRYYKELAKMEKKLEKTKRKSKIKTKNREKSKKK